MKVGLFFYECVLLCAFFMDAPFLCAQSNIVQQIQLLSPDIIGEATLDRVPFFAWVKEVNTATENILKGEKGNKVVIIQVSIHKDEVPDVFISAKPKLSKSTTIALQQALSKNSSIRARYTDYHFALMAQINEGCERDEKFSPQFVLPLNRELSRFEALELPEKNHDLTQWIINEVIPLLAFHSLGADTLFSGVLAVGKALNNQNYSRKQVDSLTSCNSSYWRGVMEMNKGNQLIPFAKVCLHIAAGEMDKADRLLLVLGFFMDDVSLPTLLVEELRAKLELLKAHRQKEINTGLVFQHKGKHQKAIDHYEKWLLVFPNSAEILYRWCFSVAALHGDTLNAEVFWRQEKENIFRCDPMYPLSVESYSGQEAYFSALRNKTKGLFKTMDAFEKDMLTYAEVALDLDYFDFSAQLYWLMLSNFELEDQSLLRFLTHYLYCLEKLGLKDMKNNFEGDFTKAFSQIEKERINLMQESPFYKDFQEVD